jgi:hypothetical protein
LPSPPERSDCTSSRIPDQRSNFSSVLIVFRLSLSPPELPEEPAADAVPLPEEELPPPVEVDAVSDPDPDLEVSR